MLIINYLPLSFPLVSALPCLPYIGVIVLSLRELTENLFCDKKEAAWILFRTLSNRALLIEAGGCGV